MVRPTGPDAMVVRLEPDVDDDEEAFTYSEWLSILGVSDAAGIKGGGPARLTERCVNRQDAECDAGIKPLASEPPPELSADVNLDSSFEPGPGQNWLHQELGSLQRQLEYANEALASTGTIRLRKMATRGVARLADCGSRGERGTSSSISSAQSLHSASEASRSRNTMAYNLPTRKSRSHTP